MARQDATEGFRGFSTVPEIMEDIVVVVQLVCQWRIEQNDADPAAVISEWYTGNHRTQGALRYGRH